MSMSKASITLRVLTEQRDLIDQTAKLMGKNRSVFILEAACESAKNVLFDQAFFRLDTKKLKQITKLLDASAPNSGLERLMVIKAPWDKGNE